MSYGKMGKDFNLKLKLCLSVKKSAYSSPRRVAILKVEKYNICIFIISVEMMTS